MTVTPFLRSLTPARTLVREAAVERGGTPLSRLWLGETVVLSRALCHFERMPAPPGRRGPRAVRAAELAARARSPFPDPRFRLVWDGDHVGVWSWEASSVPADADPGAEVLPETLLHPPAEGAVLRAGLDGVEGQVWSAGALTATRWWRSQPAPAEWAAFLRAARAPASAEPPAPERPALRARPTATESLAERLTRRLRPLDAATAAILLLAAPAAFYGLQAAHLAVREAGLETRLQRLQGETAELEAARARAMAARADLAAYAGVIERTHPAELLALLTETLSGFGAALDAFELRGERIEARFSAEGGFEPAALVQALEAEPRLAGVTLEPGRRSGDWTVAATIEEAA